MNASVASPLSETSVAEVRTLYVENDLGLDLEFSYVPAINLALQQNCLPIVRELKISNLTEEDFRDLTCVISSEPEFFKPVTLHIDAVDADEEIALNEPDIPLNYTLLSTLSDTLTGTLTVKIYSEDGVRLLGKSFPLSAYAPDQWLGMGSMPELLAAFVTPNLEIVSSIMASVASELERATGSSSVEGYLADKKRVYEICTAIYRVVQGMGIRYSTPPSSFGAPGQRIRFADTICQYRLGTCLDLALFFAGILEQCRLHPVVLIQRGHAYIGCHLKKYYFPDIPMEDLQTIRKLVELDEFVVWESTCVCGDSTFSEAEAEARGRHLNADEEFEFAIDIVRARNSAIHPLPLLRSAGGIVFAETAPKSNLLIAEQKRTLQDAINLDELSGESSVAARIRRWQQKLLDLSLRNRLLNVRETHQVVPLVCADITKLEDQMAANRTLTLSPLSQLLSEKDLHDIALLRTTEIKTEIRALLEKELEQKRLWTALPEDEMQRRLTGLYRQARTDLEEGGLNTLFLGIGFLEWKVSPNDADSLLAPILLMPVRLQRRSRAENITVTRLDEDTMINVTLLELLRQDFNLTIPGLDPLPTDESGVNVARVLQIFRQAILKMRGWEVREELRLGLFSFGKFGMWNDLANRTDELRDHPIVNHLIDGGGAFDDGVSVFPPEKIGENLEPDKLFCPMNADSSQLTAVRYSELGKSFVLHGPPGTGKSQTITNIIAHNLALGRRVLFVSEKKAALDVVHHRLCSVGLRPFCLELHSNKAGKSDVMKQFAEALAVTEEAEPEDWAETVARLERSREELNVYVAELHKIYPNGFSANACFSRIFKAGTDKVPDFGVEVDCLTHSREAYNAMMQTGADLVSAFSATTAPAREAFSVLAPADWSPDFEKSLALAEKSAKDAAYAFSAEFRKFTSLFIADLPDLFAPEKITAARKIVECLKAPKNIPVPLFSAAFPQDDAFLRELRGHFETRDALEQKLGAFNTERLPELDCDGLAERIREIRSKFFLVRPFAARALFKELGGIKKLGGGKLSLGMLEALLPDIREFCAKKVICEKASARAEALLGDLWNLAAPDWERVSSVLDTAGKLFSAAGTWAVAGTENFAEILRSYAKIFPFAETRFAAGTTAQKEIAEFEHSDTDYVSAFEGFAETYAPKLREESISPEVFAEKLERLEKQMRHLRRGLLYLKKRYEAESVGLALAVAALENESVAPEDFCEQTELAYCRTMSDRVLSSAPVLGGFVGEHRNAEIRRFCELDERYIELSQKIVLARLIAKLPGRSNGPAVPDAQLGLLKRECEKRARHKPVRQLLEQIPELVSALKPCFLMSPLSVAQYLTPNSAMFDLVVFDEASQIPVWDAIGVIARGRQLIVVGDPKQMPPTDFFQKTKSQEDTDDPEEDIAEEEDLESILDECLAAGLFSSHLNWHYRSRHEALIAFSNRHYYDDRLMTFPAARNDGSQGVRFEFVENGTYDRRGRRTNRTEAKRLVEYVFARLADPAQRQKSMGVVTFSQAQKDLIEDLFERERVKYPEFDAFFGDGNAEPFFVKNLENVQGDERDIILFSVGYAPDASGRMSMNFGPLNRQGGERRLNVAVTRAKEQVVVFSSIHGAQIDLSRTHAVGAAHLKYFLDYAERGLRLLPKQGSENEARSGLADSIEEFLRGKGYAVRRDVGSSGTRIDVAVLQPGKTDAYLLGIECDGNAYRRQRTARDRDHLRTSVLKSLGWKIFRAWTIDWAFDREQSEQMLLDALRKAEQDAAA